MPIEPAAFSPPKPDDMEVERQLNRMLSSTVFTSAPRLSPLLKYIVEETLAEKGAKDGTGLGQHQVGFAVFENYSPDSNAVRTNATYLRSRIEKYYVEFGSDDLVLIQVPAPGYRATFSYNRTSPADRYYRRGWSYVGNFIPSIQEHSSLRLFNQAIAADSLHAAAHESKAEAELREAIYKRAISPKDPIAVAETSAREALRLQPKSWRAHVVIGAVHCCRREWKEAEASFDAALSIAPANTRNHSWFSAYLLATGRQQEALQLARGRVDERPDDLSAHLSLALFLYLARRFAEAEELARDVAESHPHSWLARFIQAFVALGTGTYEVRNAPTYYARLAKEILQVKEHYGFQYKVDEVFPGCFCLVNYCVNSYRVQEREWLNAQRLRYLEEKSGGWNGIRYEKIKEDYHLREKNWGELAPSNFAAEIYWTPLQLALGYVAVGDNDSAIVLIQEAVEQGDPLTIWLPMLPLFDSLREDSTFQTIIERMQFPGPK